MEATDEGRSRIDRARVRMAEYYKSKGIGEEGKDGRTQGGEKARRAEGKEGRRQTTGHECLTISSGGHSLSGVLLVLSLPL